MSGIAERVKAYLRSVDWKCVGRFAFTFGLIFGVALFDYALAQVGGGRPNNTIFNGRPEQLLEGTRTFLKILRYVVVVIGVVFIVWGLLTLEQGQGWKKILIGICCLVYEAVQALGLFIGQGQNPDNRIIPEYDF